MEIPRRNPLVPWAVVLGGLLGVILAGGARGSDTKGDGMFYNEAREFLAEHTKVVELCNPAGARVAITPEWQGRVMTSTCGGPAGLSFGFVNRRFIEAGTPDGHFNNYGGEERMWLCPEGGPFSLWFQPGAEQVMENWHTPPALNEGVWQVVGRPSDCEVEMAARLECENASATAFSLDVTRRVRLLDRIGVGSLLGDATASIVGRSAARMVAYETTNRVTNRGPAFSKPRGLISIWILGMMNSGPRAVVIVPYQPGPTAERGEPVKSDYFGPVPDDRLKVLPGAVLLRADAQFRSKIGVSQRRARDVLGSIDFDSGVLTLVHFTMPDDPTKRDYLNNMWGLPQAEPYRGDVVNAYNDGPNDLGSQLGAFFEIESISPAPVLQTGESLVHRHRTIHVQADRATLAALADEVLGVSLDEVEQAMR